MKYLIDFLYLLYHLLLTTPKQYRLLETEEMRSYPFSDHRYFWWCGIIFHHGDLEKWGRDKQRWAHLNIHLYQARRYLTWTSFYASYIWQFLIGSIVCRSFKAGFYTSPYEFEAYLKEENNYYLQDYDEKNIEEYWYPFRERRLFWERAGKNKEGWINFIKNF
jgi:hypothetical protein